MNDVTTITAVAVYPEGGLTEVLELTREQQKETLKRMFGSSLACVFSAGRAIPFLVYLDDEGLAKGLRENWKASILAGVPLVGPVLIVGEPDEDGNNTSVSQQLLDVIDHLGVVTVIPSRGPLPLPRDVIERQEGGENRG